MLNPYITQLSDTYIFPYVSDRLAKQKARNPTQEYYNLGVGDIALPLSYKIAQEISNAALDMTREPIGYGPASGYQFLKEAISKNIYQDKMPPDEIFISDGTNTDIITIQELFASNSSIGIVTPTYPAYKEVSVFYGKKVIPIPALEENVFLPQPPSTLLNLDMVYLCSPQNPTGVALDYNTWEKWITWAKKNNVLLVIDAVYAPFISSAQAPSSIYELPGARDVAIELRSFSKHAGFTGLRCAFASVPKEVGNGKVYPMWSRWIETKTNGVSYPMQKGALATFSTAGKSDIAQQLREYKTATHALHTALEAMGHITFGGIDSPYIWWKAPPQWTDIEFFNYLLENHNVLGIPSSGFSQQCTNFVRLSGFTTSLIASKAVKSLLGCPV